MTTIETNKQSVKSTASILVIDDDQIISDSLKEFLELEGHCVRTAGDFGQARNVLDRGDVEIVLTDLNLPDHDGLEVLRYLRQHRPDTVGIVITAYGSINSAVEAIKLGAHDYLTKPIVAEELRLAIERALKQQSLQAENLALRHQLRQCQQFGPLIGRDRQMQKVFSLIEAVAPTSTTVLITGDSGTGKSMVAREIHRRSPRCDGPFIEVSCGALPENLLESELFGHVRGSFTGALADKEGRFLAADGGTIFLDEIDSATPALQVKLLRVLQERRFEPVGSNKTIAVDVRVTVATNKDLKKLVESEKFRQDLYYRINVVDISLAPLRERVSDIPLLANHFLEKFRTLHRKSVDKLSPEALNVLERYHWPGNVRELENVIERAIVLATDNVISPDDLPADLLSDDRREDLMPAGEGPTPLAELLVQAERRIIRRTLDRHNWNRKSTAEALGISRTSLFRKMRQLDLQDRHVAVNSERQSGN